MSTPSPPDLETIVDPLALAVERHRDGDLVSAALLYRQSIAARPSGVDALNGLAAAELGSHQPDRAERRLRRAEQVSPGDPRVIVNRVLAAADRSWVTQGQLARALALAPAMPAVLDAIADRARERRRVWLGRASAAGPSIGRLLRLVTELARDGARDAARRLCRAALSDSPGNADLLNGLGTINYDAGDLEGGTRGFLRTLAVQRLHAAAWANLALALHDIGRLVPAIEAARRALVLAPSQADAHTNLGNAALEAISPLSAVVSLRRALCLQPGRPSCLSNLVMALSYIADGASRQSEVAIAWWRWHGWTSKVGRSARSGSRLRVGYVSSFSLASTRHLGLAAIAQHDPEDIELFAYVQRRRGSTVPPIGRALRQTRDISMFDDDAAAKLIEVDEIDVLVDLCGHTPGNRLGVFALRPASVQATWIESFFTTGLPAIDWFITDRDHSPPDQSQVFAERRFDLGRPRFCYAPPVNVSDPVPPPSVRNGYVTFGCFNYPPKIGEAVIGLWASILHGMPTSRLRLKWWSMTEPGVAALLRARFARFGIDSSRLDLVGASPHTAMLAEYGEVDVALDPFPFTGGVTTCEALWMGVPVVSLVGHTVIERQSGCLLRAVGAQDLVAESVSAYREIAMTIAGDEPARVARRKTLRHALLGSPLTDAAGMARALEVAYRRMAGGS